MKDAIRVFISYSGDDWTEYVEPLASALRKSGIDAVAANWDFQGGESLVQRILEEEIPRADAVVIILSKTSVTRPWVIEELDHATVRRIVDRIKLIPFKVEECDVPSSLRTLKRISLRHPDELEDRIKEVIDAIYGYVNKPVLGPVPSYYQPNNVFPDLTALEGFVLENICHTMMYGEHITLDSKELIPALTPKGLSSKQLNRTLARLHARHLILADKGLSGSYFNVRLSPSTAIRFCEREVPNYHEIKREILSTVAEFADNVMWTPSFHDYPNETWFAYRTALAELESRGAFKITWGLGKWCMVTNFSPFIEDWLDDM